MRAQRLLCTCTRRSIERGCAQTRSSASTGNLAGKVGGAALEVAVEPPERASPQEPFVHVPEEHRAVLGLPAEELQELMHLRAPLRGAKPEVRGHDAQPGSVAHDVGRDGTSRLASAPAEV